MHSPMWMKEVPCDAPQLQPEPAKTIAVDDAREESAERLAFLYRQLGHTGTEQLAKRCLSAESKVAELEAQLRQEREARDRADIKFGDMERRCIASEAQAAQLQTTISQQAHEFKNFHQHLCSRFGYFHDDIDWKQFRKHPGRRANITPKPEEGK